MSIPTHNLYDFVHQATERRFWLYYFYPWGSKGLDCLYEYQIDPRQLNGPCGIPVENRFDFEKYNLNVAEETFNLYRWTQPDMICHDQEPLNFSLYNKESNIVKNFNSLEYKFDNLNLKIPYCTSIYKKSILLHSELNSTELKKYIDTDLFTGAFWWSHAVIARDWYRYAEHDQELSHVIPRKTLFLSYCRRIDKDTMYRQEFLNRITDLGLRKDCLIESVTDQRPELSAEYHAGDFLTTAISVVLETTFDERIHLTEKTLRPIACGHPFIVLNGPGCLKFLKRYGFKTFDPYINERYDNIQDHTQRLDAVTKEMKRLAEMNKNDLDDILHKCKDIACYNKKLFFSAEFLEMVAEELKNNVNFAYEEIRDLYSVDTWISILNSRRRKRKSGEPVVKDQERLTLFKLIKKLRTTL